jgi:insertion element IS1 protein InsB
VQAEEITCPRCSARNIKKNGTTANAKQRFRCRRCGRQFVARYSYRGRDPEVRRMVVPLALNGCGVRDTARVLQISPTTVLKLLKAQAGRVRRRPLPARLIELEVDELWSFVGDKSRQAWLWYAFEPRSRQVVAWVVGRRTDQTCRRLLRQLRRCQVLRFRTDDWESYEEAHPGSASLDGQSLDAKNRAAELELPHAPQEAAPADDLLFKERGDARGGYQALHRAA